MALQILEELLRGYTNSLCTEGFVNDHFLSLKTTGEPERFVQTIEKYFADVDVIISELSSHVDNSKANFSKLISLVKEIQNKSASIGARHMKVACSVLVKSGDKKQKRKFFRDLLWLNHEYCTTRSKLESVAQMERRIIRLRSSQSQN